MSIFLKLKTTLVLGICAFAFSPDFVDARVGEEKSKVEIRLFRSGGLAIKEENSFGTNKGEVLLINLKIISHLQQKPESTSRHTMEEDPSQLSLKRASQKVGFCKLSITKASV